MSSNLIQELLYNEDSKFKDLPEETFDALLKGDFALRLSKAKTEKEINMVFNDYKMEQFLLGNKKLIVGSSYE